MTPNQTEQEILLSEARRYLAEVQSAESDIAFVEAFDLLWHFLKHEPPVPMAAIPISDKTLNDLLEEFGRRATFLITNSDPRAARCLWRVTQQTPGLNPAEMWRRVGVPFSWYLAEIQRMVRMFYAELQQGRLDRARDLVFMPMYDEATLSQLLGPRCRTVITQGFVNWVEAEYQALSCSAADATVVIQRAVYVAGLASHGRSRLDQRQGPIPTYLLPYQQLDPLVKQLLALISSYRGK